MTARESSLIHLNSARTDLDEKNALCLERQPRHPRPKSSKGAVNQLDDTASGNAPKKKKKRLKIK